MEPRALGAPWCAPALSWGLGPSARFGVLRVPLRGSWACGSARLRARFGHIPSGELGPLLALGVKISAPAAGRDAGGPLHGGADQEHRRPGRHSHQMCFFAGERVAASRSGAGCFLHHLSHKSQEPGRAAVALLVAAPAVLALGGLLIL